MHFMRTCVRPTTFPHRRPRTRVAVVAAVCTGVAVVAAACSSSGSANGAPAASPSSTAGGGVSMSASQALKLAADQARKITSLTASMNVTSRGSLATHLTGTLAEQLRPTVLAHETFKITGSSQHMPGIMQTLLTGDAVYFKISALAATLGKPWVKIPFSSVKQAGLNLAPIINQLRINNPLAQTELLEGASGVQRVGTQVINGVPTTEYTGVVHPGAALAKLNPSMRPQLQPALSSMKIKIAHFTVWVDAQHQVRKLAVTLSGTAYRVSSVIVITSINQPVHIQVPPASQVANVPGL
jgi:hypothetical protein